MAGQFAVEQDGRYTIRSGEIAGAWSAQAYLQRLVVGPRAIGTSRDEAIAKAKAALADLRDARISARGADGSPSTDEYREAFSLIAPINPNHRAMLKAHLAAQDCLITATQLAEAACYPNWNAANLQYGTLAKNLADHLDFKPELRADGSPIWTSILATWPLDGDLENEQVFDVLERRLHGAHFMWLMRPQVRPVVAEL